MCGQRQERRRGGGRREGERGEGRVAGASSLGEVPDHLAGAKNRADCACVRQISAHTQKHMQDEQLHRSRQPSTNTSECRSSHKHVPLTD